MIWLNIVSPILVFVGTAINIYISNKNSKDKINADLVAQSRIEWIQSVRSITTELLESHYEMFDLYYSNSSQIDIQNKLNEIRQKTMLFSLYFSYLNENNEGFNFIQESNQNINAERSNNKLITKLFRTDNSHKNSIMVNLVESLDLMQHYTINSLKRNGKITKQNFNSQAIISRYLNLFQRAVSLYLKIEWDKAKNNK